MRAHWADIEPEVEEVAAAEEVVGLGCPEQHGRDHEADQGHFPAAQGTASATRWHVIAGPSPPFQAGLVRWFEPAAAATGWVLLSHAAA